VLLSRFVFDRLHRGWNYVGWEDSMPSEHPIAVDKQLFDR